MIRSRDFMLVLVVLAFGLLIGFYGLQSTESIDEPVTYTAWVPTPPVEVGAEVVVSAGDGIDRAAILRSKIAAGEGVSLSAPPVFTSVDTPVLPAEPELGVSSSSDTTVQYCGAIVANPSTTSWPVGSKISLTADKRTVQHTVTTEVAVGSSTEFTTEEVTYVTLPVRTIRSTFDTCLPDTTIGITTTGQPLDNRAVGAYAAAPPQAVIGYTRDGFVLYGSVSDSSVLDNCGGQYVAGVYQYHILPGDQGLIACYGGVPIKL